jgi:carboxypeptidase C (cathepsin A)
LSRFYASLIRVNLVLVALGLGIVAASAQDAPAHGGGGSRGAAHPAAESSAQAHAPRLPADAVTHHEMTLAGRTLAYTATAGTLPLSDEKGEQTAEIFYVAFTLDGVSDVAHRPVTYVFNGGPGAASAYLDIGAIGPRALDLGPAGTLPPKSATVTDNADSWLPFTDLVFVDPVGTGYSQAVGGADAAAKQFWGVQQDLDALEEIVRLHLTRSGRLGAPVYLVGESYGGFRAARLAHDLPRNKGVTPAGVLLISPVLEFRLMEGDQLDLLPWALHLPSYAATNLAQEGAIKPDALAAAEHFAMTDYLTALAAGEGSAADSAALYAKLAQLTGLDQDRIASWRGLIPPELYVREIRRRDGETVSSYDATVAITNTNPWGGGSHDDPVLDATIAPFTTAFVAYARDELGFKTDLPFELLDREVSRHWDWGGGHHGPPDSLGASEALDRALALQPQLKVLIAHGLTDVLTPYMMSRYVVTHLPQNEQSRVALKLYDGGHMMYLRETSRHRLHDDAQAFYTGAAAN